MSYIFLDQVVVHLNASGHTYLSMINIFIHYASIIIGLYAICGIYLIETAQLNFPRIKRVLIFSLILVISNHGNDYMINHKVIL